jgi:hypothetical protein
MSYSATITSDKNYYIYNLGFDPLTRVIYWTYPSASNYTFTINATILNINANITS